MKYFLVIESDCYADEFDLSAFAIYSSLSEEYLKMEIKIALEEGHGKFPLELYFGTNEPMEYESFESLMKSLSIKEISKQEKINLENFFPVLKNGHFGTSAILSHIYLDNGD